MLLCLLVAALPAAAPAPAGAAPRELAFSQGWELKGDAALGSQDGREALAVGTGWAYRRDLQLRDGTVELDVKVTGRRSFVYVTFRMENDREYEEIYLRPHKSGLPDAAQYAPVRQGKSAWQLHHGPGGTAAVPLEHGKWTHLRLVLRDQTAALYLGAEARPAFVARLDRESRAGYLALRAFAADGAKGPVAWFSSVRTAPEAEALAADLVPPSPVDPPGVVKAWAVSDALAAPGEPALGPPPPPKATARCPPSRAEWSPSCGTSRCRPRPGAGRLRPAFTCGRKAAGLRRLDLGWSDTATVYLNGRPLFRADAAYSFDEPRQEGLVHLGQASVFLPLEAGDNELVVVVTDDFGGWAVMGRFPDDRGLLLEAR